MRPLYDDLYVPPYEPDYCRKLLARAERMEKRRALRVQAQRAHEGFHPGIGAVGRPEAHSGDSYHLLPPDPAATASRRYTEQDMRVLLDGAEERLREWAWRETQAFERAQAEARAMAYWDALYGGAA